MKALLLISKLPQADPHIPKYLRMKFKVCWGVINHQVAKKIFFDDLSNSVRPFDYKVKAGQSARPKT